jgi:beta-glucosidase
MKQSRLVVGVVAILMTVGMCLAQAQPAQQARGGRGGAGGRGGFPVGPAAPVPPEVAIPRPSPDELAQINSALKHFVDTDNSPAKTLLKKYESLLTIQAPRPNIAATYTETNVRAPRHDEFVEIAKKGDIDLLLEGDSITDWWINRAQGGQPRTPTAAYTKYFGNIRTADFAVAGDTTQGVLWGLKNGEGQGFSPKAIMLMIGTNNLGTNNITGNSPEEIAEGIGAIILENRKDFPNAKILLLAVFPRSTPDDPARERIAQINKIIQKLDDHQHVFYMDIGPKFLGPDGAFLPDTFLPDNLHPQEKGYDIWGAAVIDTLKSWLK